MMKLGRHGAWLNPIDDDTARTEYAVEAEALGYGTVWLGLGTRDESDLRLAERVLDATSHVVVATAIVNMWTNDRPPWPVPTDGCKSAIPDGSCSAPGSDTQSRSPGTRRRTSG
jgi:hypothetical protein